MFNYVSVYLQSIQILNKLYLWCIELFFIKFKQVPVCVQWGYNLIIIIFHIAKSKIGYKNDMLGAVLHL